MVTTFQKKGNTGAHQVGKLVLENGPSMFHIIYLHINDQKKLKK